MCYYIDRYAGMLSAHTVHGKHLYREKRMKIQNTVLAIVAILTALVTMTTTAKAEFGTITQISTERGFNTYNSGWGDGFVTTSHVPYFNFWADDEKVHITFTLVASGYVEPNINSTDSQIEFLCEVGISNTSSLYLDAVNGHMLPAPIDLTSSSHSAFKRGWYGNNYVFFGGMSLEVFGNGARPVDTTNHLAFGQDDFGRETYTLTARSFWEAPLAVPTPGALALFGLGGLMISRRVRR